LYKCKKEGKSRTCSACLVTSPNRRSNLGCSSWITRKFWLWFLQTDFIENPYSFITHMLLSMHVHFLIITNIHISWIFSKLVSQCASVRMIQFFYIHTYNIHVKVYCYYLTLNYYCPTVGVWIVTVQRLVFELLLSNCCCLNSYCPTVAVWTVAVQLLLFELLLSNGCCLNTHQIFNYI
jgi:hypothetical protein